MGVDYFNTDCCNEILDDCGDYGRRCLHEHFICYECFEAANGFPMEEEHMVEDKYECRVLGEKFCPVCQEIAKNKQDPEYAEYLRLKAKFED